MINLSMGQPWTSLAPRIATPTTLQEADYLQMCAYKTAHGTDAAKMAAVLSGAEPKLVEKLGA